MLVRRLNRYLTVTNNKNSYIFVFPIGSTSSSVLNTTYPPGSTVFGSIPPPSTYSASTRMSIPTFVAFVCLVITVIASDVYK